ncbi:MAG: hypothetical protein ACOZAN_02435 [Patescibacteria group bacterium]
MRVKERKTNLRQDNRVIPNKIAIFLVMLIVVLFKVAPVQADFVDEFEGQHARWAWGYYAGTGYHNSTTYEGLTVAEAGITNLTTSSAYSDSSIHENINSHNSGALEMRIKCTDDNGQTDAGVGSRGWGYWNGQFGAQNNSAWFWSASPQSDAAYSGLRAMVVVNGSVTYNYLINGIDIKEWHTYRVDLAADGTHFLVDGVEVAYTATKPTANMRIEIWLDNYRVPTMTYLASTLNEKLYIDWVRLYDQVQTPTVSSLTQYKLDGTTAIADGGWTNETGAILKLNATSPYTRDNITPQFEVRPQATSFSNSSTNNGSVVNYSGSSVPGTVTVSGLADGSTYHWQARSVSAAGAANWLAKGGAPDFGVDTTSPSFSTTPSVGTSATQDRTPSWTWTAASDSSSGLASTPYVLEWSTDESFSTGVETTTASSNSFSHVTSLDDGNWYFRVKASDQAGNSTYSATGSVVIDNLAPTISSVSNTAAGTSASVSWSTNENASTIVDYGLSSSYGSSTTETDSGTGVTTHSATIPALAECATYHYRTRSIDPAGNETSGSDSTFTTTGCSGDSTISDKTSSELSSSTGGTVSLSSGGTQITLDVPTEYSVSTATFQVHKLSKDTVFASISQPSGYSAAGENVYDLKALTGPNTTLSSFSNPITITMSYTASDVASGEESNLKIWRYDGSSWNMLSNCSTNTSNRTVSCTTANFSLFGLFKKPATTSTSSSVTSSSHQEEICTNEPPGAKAPWIYAAIPQNDSSILLYFADADDPVDSYTLVFGEKSGDYPYGSVNIGGKGTRTYLVQSLSANKTYYFKIQGKNGCQPGAWSNEIAATTLSGANGGYRINSSELTPITKSPSDTDSSQDLLNPSEQNNSVENKTNETSEKQLPEFKGYNINVKLSDTEGKPLEGVKVILHSEPKEAITNNDGVASFSGVEPGDHKVIIEDDKFQGEQSINLSGTNSDFNLNITLRKENQLSPVIYLFLGACVCLTTLWVIKKISNRGK